MGGVPLPDEDDLDPTKLLDDPLDTLEDLGEDLEKQFKSGKEEIGGLDLESGLVFGTTGQTVPGAAADPAVKEARPAIREVGEAVGLDLPTPSEIEERKKRGAETAAGQRAIATKKKKEDARRRGSSALQSRLEKARRRALGSETILG